MIRGLREGCSPFTGFFHIMGGFKWLGLKILTGICTLMRIYLVAKIFIFVFAI